MSSCSGWSGRFIPLKRRMGLFEHTHLPADLPQKSRIIVYHSREADWDGGELKQHLGRGWKEEKGHPKVKK